MRLTTALLVPLLLTTACEAPTPRSARRALGAPEAGTSCNAVSYQGCCIGQALLYCAASQLQVDTCSSSAPCGWSTAFGIYTCGGSVPADPSNAFPRDCKVDFGLPIPDAPAPLDAQAADAAPGCGPLGYIGCCTGQTLYFCSGSQVLSLDCTGQPSCGWNASGGFYDCNTTGTPDPAGAHPMSCETVLGDSGVALDGLVGLDSGTDLAPVDLSTDAGDGALDGPPVPGDLLSQDAEGRDGGTDGDGAVDGGVGLDASGLDVSGHDGNGAVKPGGGGGCSGCATTAAAGPPATFWAALALLGLLGARKRR